ncbi:transposase [Extensimonas vulgaris]|nr:transposase [Extensimonas vulgaris]
MTVHAPARSSSSRIEASAADAASTPVPRPSKLLGKPLDEHEMLTLQEMAAHHPYADFRRRALGLLALQRGHKVAHICELLQVSDQPVYNWAKSYRTQGLAGILDGHKGGAPRKLSEEMVDAAVQIAREQALSLGQIAQQLHQRYPDAPSFSLARLSVWLKKRGLSYKRGRRSLKKSAMPASSSA